MRRSLLPLACLALLVLLPGGHATPQDPGTSPGAAGPPIASQLDGPFVIVGMERDAGASPVNYLVCADSSQPIRTWSELREAARLRDVAGLRADLAAAADAAGRDDDGISELRIALVARPDVPWRGLHDALLAITHPSEPRVAAVHLLVIVTTADGEALGEGVPLALPVDPGISVSSPVPAQHLRIVVRSIPGAQTDERLLLVPDPLAGSLRPEEVRNDASLHRAVASMLSDNSDLLSDRVELQLDAGHGVAVLDQLIRGVRAYNVDVSDDGQPVSVRLILLPRVDAGEADNRPAAEPQEMALGAGTADAVEWMRTSGGLQLPDAPRIVPPAFVEPDDRDVVGEDPVDDPRIVEEATDNHNEDPTNDPTNQDLRPNPNPDQSGVESPYPGGGFNNAIGMGGNLGGGSGPGSGSGFACRREQGPAHDNVIAALRWLQDHQHEDGYWDPVDYAGAGSANGRDGSYDNRDGSSSTGWEETRVGLTGLALLACLGAGHTHTDGDFADTLKGGLRYLKRVQDNDGCFGSRDDMHIGIYNHAIATMAMCEAFAMSGSNQLREPARKAVDFIAMSQNHDPDEGHLGWRYGVQPGDNDTSVTGWMVMALKSAKVAGLDVPDHCFEGAERWMSRMTGVVRGYPKTGYIQRGGDNARLPAAQNFATNGTMDALNIYASLTAFGRQRADVVLQSQADQITRDLPTIEDPHRVDYYYWYAASLAVFQMGGGHWERWEGPMRTALIGSQRLEGEATDACHGSWDSTSAWGSAGGRVYATAMNCLTLEVYHRYERVALTASDSDDENGDD